MSKPVANLKNRIRYAIETFEGETGQTVKSLKLNRLDQPVIFQGSETDLVDIDVSIKG